MSVNNLPIGDILITLRDKFIDWVAWDSGRRVLNPAPPIEASQENSDLAAGLKRALDHIQETAFLESGAHVDYNSLRSSPAYQEFRQECTAQLRKFDPGSLSTRAEKLAFWINLYNALVIDAVIALDIRSSVSEGWLGVLRFFRRAAYNVGGQRISLDDIEHGILRGNRGHPYLPGPQFKSSDRRLEWVLDLEPRIHFAINCASRSCPPIQVYTAERLESQLDLAARNFVAADLTLNVDRNEMVLSRIFQWFEQDFGGREGVLIFLGKHLSGGERRAWLESNSGKIRLTYKVYDWGLNI